MAFNRFIFFVFFFILVNSTLSNAQISQGGMPMKTAGLKSSKRKVIEMPPLENFMMVEEATKENLSDDLLKPFQFAYPFQVNFTPSNSGDWVKGNNGFLVWKLNIHSKGAKSLNLIFDEFEIPSEARLFVYNKDENHILGAFTNRNNKASGKFAISPVLGEEITIQYEIPQELSGENHFRIVTVNHDYIGILKSGDRRPLGKVAGAL